MSRSPSPSNIGSNLLFSNVRADDPVADVIPANIPLERRCKELKEERDELTKNLAKVLNNDIKRLKPILMKNKIAFDAQKKSFGYYSELFEENGIALPDSLNYIRYKEDCDKKRENIAMELKQLKADIEGNKIQARFNRYLGVDDVLATPQRSALTSPERVAHATPAQDSGSDSDDDVIEFVPATCQTRSTVSPTRLPQAQLGATANHPAVARALFAQDIPIVPMHQSASYHLHINNYNYGAPIPRPIPEHIPSVLELMRGFERFNIGEPQQNGAVPAIGEAPSQLMMLD